ncbi:MAG: hypothetical protein PVG66_00680 [Chromatiales bacterium]|jgi:hypothetical protein
MHPALFLLALLFPLSAAHAEPWEFDAPIAVTGVAGPKLFHHLESAGRRNIAVSGERVAVAWEDERDGTPRVYLAHKPIAADQFVNEVQISGPGEAFEPSISALDDGRFVIAWEEDARVHARIWTITGPGPVYLVEAKDSVQASLAAKGQDILLVMAERAGRFPHITLSRLHAANDNRLQASAHCAVDAESPKDEQLYPSVTWAGERIVVAWEDRRPGHTIIMASANLPGTACDFAPPQRINKRDPGRGTGGMPYGKGSGVSRVAVSAFGETEVFAAWADKRNFREGYDIYGVAWQPDSGFGRNEQVQDDFGGVASQWHASIAGHPDGSLAVAWDDERSGSPAIMLSWRSDDGWSDDGVIAGGSGQGVNAHPSITLDNAGNLHAAWVERDEINGPTRLRYAFGRKVTDN